MNRAELEKLSSKELHDRAMSKALKHFDVGYLWDLIRAVPVAEAAAGHVGEAETDAVSLTALLTDVITSGDEQEVADQLRPMYIDYLASD